MKNLFYRIRQAFLSAFLIVMPEPKQKLVTGTDSILQLPELLKADGIEKILLVTTAGFIKRETLQPLFESLKTAQIGFSVFSGVMPDPTIECIEEGYKVFLENKCQAVVAIGGGSVLDCSKVIAARAARPHKSVYQLAGLFKINKKICRLYAVPTTAGTGSEVTAGAVVTDTQTSRKFTVLDLNLVPSRVILDPQLTLTVPPAITAATGIDALTHAVEAYTNCFRSRKARQASLKAVDLILKNLLPAFEDGQNLEARSNMLLGSYYAGVAIENAYVGYVHALAHGVGGLYHVTHGVANAVILPAVLKLFGAAVYDKLADLADLASLEGKNNKEKAEKFIALLKDINRKTGLPEKLAVKESDIPEIVRRAKKEANPMYPVPVIWQEKELELAVREFSV